MIEDLWSGLIQFSGQFIVPDWGSLVQLIPLAIAGAVFLYVSWTTYRFVTAAPTRRGIRRLPPVAPAGIHMPGPSFAPLLAAFGAFMLMFGMVSGGLWLWAGLLILVITLLYWGREALRDYDHVAHPVAGDGGLVSGGAGVPAAALVPPGPLPAPRGTPPAGVHIPPPSFRPLLVSISMTILVAGMIFGGWALLFGVVAVAVTLVGWLRDSGREYVAVDTADRSGHLDLGGAPAWPKATFAVLGVIVAAAVLLNSGVLPNSHPAAEPAASGGAPAGSGGSGGGGGASAAPSLPAADVTLTAQGIAFLETTLTAPAGKPFTVAFDNRDPAQHNLEIKDASGASLFRGEIVTGPAVKVYSVPALAAGQYPFVCSVHPAMTGTLTVK